MEETHRRLPKHMTATIIGENRSFNVVKINGSDKTYRGWCPYHDRGDIPAMHVTWGGEAFRDMFFCMTCKRTGQAELQDTKTGKRPKL